VKRKTVKKVFAKILLLAGAMTIAAAGSAAHATGYGRAEPPPVVGLQSHPNYLVPLDATFRNEEGKIVKLGEFFKPGKPVLIMPVYYGCKQTCTGSLSALVQALDPRPLRLEIGRDFEVVTISIDPTETPELAKEKRANYLKALGQPDLVGGWHFLTGEEAQILRVTDRLGFYYAKDESKDAAMPYDHAAALYVLSPDGRISSTIAGMTYSEPTVSLHDQLVNASNGKIGGFIGVLTKCGLMKYDPKTGRFVHNPWMWAATIGGTLSIITVGVFLGSLWRGEYKKAKLAKQNGMNKNPLPGSPAAGL
jgi:protein SCO1/2